MHAGYDTGCNCKDADMHGLYCKKYLANYAECIIVSLHNPEVNEYDKVSIHVCTAMEILAMTFVIRR